MSDLSIPEPVPYATPLDIQHDTDPAHEVHARRIPHIGHAALFFALAIFFVVVCQIAALLVEVLVLHPHAVSTTKTLTSSDLHAAGVGQLIGYALTFAVAIPVFPMMWDKSFADGISWTPRAALLRWWKLVPLGVAMSIVATLCERFVHVPKDVLIEKVMDSTSAAWMTAISAAIVGPIVEEIGFRGFLLPALATAYDWLSLERTPAALQRWRETTSHTPLAWVLASVVSSAAFAALHGQQLHWPLGVLGILFCVSLVLSAVRIRLQSVAASAIVHVSYNSVLMAVILIQTGGFRHLDKLTH